MTKRDPRIQEIYDLGGNVVSVHLAEKYLERDALEPALVIRDDEPLYYVAYAPPPGSGTLQGYKGDDEVGAAVNALQSLKELSEERGDGEVTLECSSCGSDMHRDTLEGFIGYRSVILTYEQPGWYCGSCDEVVYNGADAAVAEETFLKAKAQYQELNDALNRIIRD